MSSSNTQKRSSSNLILGMLVVVTLLVGLGAGYFVGHQGTGSTSTTITSMEITSGSMTEQPVSGLLRPSTIPLVEGWYRGGDISYLDYGPNPNVAAPILAFFWENGTAVLGQRNVIDTIPGQPGYSDFWRVFKVVVPSNYVPNSIRSFDEAVSSGHSIQPTNIVVNCPVVNPGTTIQGGSGKLVEGWYRDRAVYYFDQGTNSPAAGFVVQSAPIFAFFWDNGTSVAGQRNVVDVRPGDVGYSDLWNVTKVIVKLGYVPNTLKDAHAILAQANAGNVAIEPSNIFVNCPVLP